MILISVDLPAPFSPISACTLPRASTRSTPSRATTPGKRLSMPRISSAGPVAASALGARASSACIGAPPHQVEPGGEDDDDAGHHHLQVLVPSQDDDAVVDDLQHQHTEEGAYQRAAAARQAGAAEDDRGDD